MIKNRRVLDIEDVLTWAYRDELPKRRDEGGGGEPCSISPMFRGAALGTRIDSWSREPGMPAALGDPHPDSLLVEAAVGELVAFRDRPLGMEPGWLSSDFTGLAVDEAGALVRAGRTIDLLVIVNAKLRRRPLYDGRPTPGPTLLANNKPSVLAPELRSETAIGGRTVKHEVLVATAAIRAGIYRPGARSPVTWSPDPQSVTLERAEYAVWRAALVFLAERLEGQLASISVLSPSAPERPWLGEQDAGKPVAIYEDLRAAVHRTDRAERLRRTPAPPRRRPKDAATARGHVPVRSIPGALLPDRGREATIA